MKNKKFIIGVGVGLLSGIVGLVLIGMMRRTGNIQALEIPKVFKEVEDTSEYDKTKLTLLDAIIDRYYIHPDKEFDAVEGIYKGYVYGLEDPYTVYLNEESFTKVTAEEKGNYVGVGIRFAWGATNQHLIVTEVIEDSPASKEDIKIGDKIMLIDGIKAMASNEVEIYEKLAYAGKESVEYTFVDNDETNERKIKLVPKEVEINLLHTEMLQENVGYIQLDGVTKGTAKEVETAVAELMNEGAERLVVDLRSVYTNELEEAVAIADLFLENQTICGVKDKKGEVTTYEATEGAVQNPLAVLVNGQTSGATEAIVAALQAKGDVNIVGVKTAGHGTLQENVALGDGSGLSIATSFILDANDKPIKDNPIIPTIVQHSDLKTTLELVTTGKIDKANDSVLQKAIENLQ